MNGKNWSLFWSVWCFLCCVVDLYIESYGFAALMGVLAILNYITYLNHAVRVNITDQTDKK